MGGGMMGGMGGAIVVQNGSSPTITNAQFDNGEGSDVNGDSYAYAGSGPTPPGMPQYVSHGTYSLPVSLPAGGVQIDFARPTGGASLSIWAVDAKLISNIYGTATIAVSLLIALAAMKFWPRPSAKKNMRAIRLIGYFALLLIATAILGAFGCGAAIILIALMEAARGAFAVN
jgi:hypothetical protein